MEICFCLIFDFEILQIVTNCLYFLIEFAENCPRMLFINVLKSLDFKKAFLKFVLSQF